MTSIIFDMAGALIVSIRRYHFLVRARLSALRASNIRSSFFFFRFVSRPYWFCVRIATCRFGFLVHLTSYSFTVPSLELN